MITIFGLYRVSILSLIFSLVAACGGSGGGGSGAGPEEPNNEIDPPIATIKFPGLNALLTNPEVTLRGTVTDESIVSSVSVNGIEATIDTNQTPTPWQLDLTLTPGQQVLNIRTEDEFGNVDETAAVSTLKVISALTPAAIGIAVASNGNLFLVDRDFQLGPKKVVEIDPVTGVRRVVTDSRDGKPNSLQGPQAIAVANDGQIFVVDNIRNAVIQIDPDTGERTVLSGDDPDNPGMFIGSGPALSDPNGIAIFNNSEDLLITDNLLDAVIRIARSNGDRSIVSESIDGQPVTMTDATDIIISKDDSSYFVTDFRKVIKVMPNGDRSLVIDGGVGGANFLDLNDIDVGLDDSLLVSDRAGFLFKIDPDTGSGAIVDQDNPGDAFQFTPIAIAVNGFGEVLVVPNFSDMVFLVDSVTGERTLLSNASIGSGQSFFNVRDVAVVNDGGIIVMDSNASSVYRVDPESGNRTILTRTSGGRAIAIVDEDLYALTIFGLFKVDPLSTVPVLISDASMGSGDPLVLPQKMAADTAGQLLVIDRPFNGIDIAIVRIDPVTGDRSLLSGRTASSISIRGSGDLWVRPNEIAVTADGKILVSDDISANTHVIVVVDPVSGDRTTLGSSFNSINGIEVINDNEILVIDSVSKVLYLVELDTGNRTEISSENIGNDILFGLSTGISAEANGTIVITDSQHVGLMRVDSLTGDRAIVSY